MIFRIEYRIKLNSFKVPTYVLPPPPSGNHIRRKRFMIGYICTELKSFQFANFLGNFIKQIIFTYPWSPKNNQTTTEAYWCQLGKIHEYYLFYFKATL